MKNIWIINQYITTPDIDGDGYRHYYIAKYLKETKQFNPLLITSSFSHAPKRHNRFRGLYKLVEKDVKTLILKGNKYRQTHGLGRITSWIIFALNLFIIPFLSKKKIPKPDIIMLSSLPLLPVLNIILFKKLFYPRAKFIFEIRDLWPLSAMELGNYSKDNLFIKILAFLEVLAYKKSDFIISVIPKAHEHIEAVLRHKHFKYQWITNGFHLPEITIDEFLAVDFKIDKSSFNIGYAGSLVISNPLDTIIKVVSKLRNKRIKLYILGAGPEKQRLKDLANTCSNIFFLDAVPKQYVDKFLSKMDILYMGKGGKRTNMYQYGTSQLKTFDYFHAKKPIIQALDSQENPVTYAKAGFVIPPENEAILREKILYFFELNEEQRLQYGLNGYNYLMENCTYDKISRTFENVLHKLY